MLISNKKNYLIGSIPKHLLDNYQPLTEDAFFTRVVIAYQQQTLESFICNPQGVDVIEARTADIGTRVKLVSLTPTEKQTEMKCEPGEAFLVMGLNTDKPTSDPKSEIDFYYGIAWVLPMP